MALSNSGMLQRPTLQALESSTIQGVGGELLSLWSSRVAWNPTDNGALQAQ